MMLCHRGWDRMAVGFSCVAMLILVSASNALASHPYHVSSAEVNWNSKTGNFEVALCVWPADLERAIAAQQSTAVDLDQVENVDELMQQYVASRFLIRSVDSTTAGDKLVDVSAAKAGEAPAIRWVGHEMDLKKAWLYFEIPGDRQPNQWEIENRVFFELNEDQMNQVQITSGRRLLAADSLSVENKRLAFATDKTAR